MRIKPLLLATPAALVLLTSSFSGLADSPALPGEDSIYFELPVVLSATRLAQPMLDTPASMTIIDREMILASGAREIYELFRMVPGFQVGSDNGSVHTVTYHGLGDQFSRRMQVLIDGRSVYTPGLGQVEWSNLSIGVDDIERIEVVRGPNAASFGANAFLGVISIHTYHSAAEQGGQLKITRGSDGVEQFRARYANSAGPLSFRTSISRRGDHGFDQRHDSKRSTLGNLRADWLAGSSDRLEFQAGFNEGTRQDGFLNDPLQNPRTKADRTHFGLLRWQHVFHPEHELSLQAYYNYFHRSETMGGNTDSGISFIPTSSPVTQRRYDLELEHRFRPATSWRVVWGGSARLDQVEAPLLFGSARPRMQNHLYRLFGNLEWRPLPMLGFNGGVMMESNDVTGTDWSPRLAVNYRIFPRVAIRASLSKSLRTPSFLENNVDWKLPIAGGGGAMAPLFLGPGTLQPESIIARELGLVAATASGTFQMELKLFRNSLRHLVGTSGVLPFNFINESSATVEGVEGQLQWRPTARARFVLSQANGRTTSADPGLEKSTPSATTHLLGIFHLGERYDASFSFSRVSQMTWLGEGNLQPSFRRLNLRLARRFGKRGREAQVALVVHNLMDKYLDFRDENRSGRAGFLQLALPL